MQFIGFRYEIIHTIRYQLFSMLEFAWHNVRCAILKTTSKFLTHVSYAVNYFYLIQVWFVCTFRKSSKYPMTDLLRNSVGLLNYEYG